MQEQLKDWLFNSHFSVISKAKQAQLIEEFDNKLKRELIKSRNILPAHELCDLLKSKIENNFSDQIEPHVLPILMQNVNIKLF